MTISAVFLDRDGVLNPHIPGGYLLEAKNLVLLPGVGQAIRRLNDAELPIAVISNQQGVGKGLMTSADLAEIEKHMAEQLRIESGAWIDRFYYSTELASAGSLRRKPNPGMLLEASAELDIALSEVVFAGDSATDIQAGHAAHVLASVLLLSGGIPSYRSGDLVPPPDYVFSNLSAMTDWILEQNR